MFTHFGYTEYISNFPLKMQPATAKALAGRG